MPGEINYPAEVLRPSGGHATPKDATGDPTGISEDAHARPKNDHTQRQGSFAAGEQVSAVMRSDMSWGWLVEARPNWHSVRRAVVAWMWR